MVKVGGKAATAEGYDPARSEARSEVAARPTKDGSRSVSSASSAATRRGRPKAKNPLSYVVNIRLTIGDGQRLDTLAETFNRDRAELARAILTGGIEKMEQEAEKYKESGLKNLKVF